MGRSVQWVGHVTLVIPNIAVLLGSPLRRRIEHFGPKHDEPLQGCGSKGEPSPHMASTKAWHDCCSCVHHEGPFHLCHKRQGYCTTSLSALSQLHGTGMERGCLASPVLSDAWRCHAHALPAWLGCEAVPDAITRLLLTQPS